MVDLSKHLQRASKSIKSRNYDLAIEVLVECHEVDPTNLEVYDLLLDAARRRQKEGGKASLMTRLGGLIAGMSKDPIKRLGAAVKTMSQGPDDKALAGVGDAAFATYQQNENQHFGQIAIKFYEEVRKSGLFNEDVLWNVGHVYQKMSTKTKNGEMLEKAISAMAELKKNKPQHPEAGRTLQNWEALRSMMVRSAVGGDYSEQVADRGEARRNELMGRVIRTREDADEVLGFLDEQIAQEPQNKQLWQKKGDVLRRVEDYAAAKAAYAKAAEIDVHDFTLQVAMGDCDIAEARRAVGLAKEGNGDIEAARQALAELELSEYRKRVQRQPTEGQHRYLLGTALLQRDAIDEAAAELQRAVGDSRYKRDCHRLLGQCFIKKKLYDLAIDQLGDYLKMTDDDHSDEAKGVIYNRARLYEQTGRMDEAKGDYRRLAEIDLGYKDAAERLGKLQSG